MYNFYLTVLFKLTFCKDFSLKNAMCAINKRQKTFLNRIDSKGYYESVNEVKKLGLEIISATEASLVFKFTGYNLILKRAKNLRHKKYERIISEVFDHPNLTNLLLMYIDKKNGFYIVWIVYEYFPLCIYDYENLTDDHYKYFLWSICSGLGRLHENNLVHFDIKSENICGTFNDQPLPEDHKQLLLNIEKEILECKCRYFKKRSLTVNDVIRRAENPALPNDNEIHSFSENCHICTELRKPIPGVKARVIQPYERERVAQIKDNEIIEIPKKIDRRVGKRHANPPKETTAANHEYIQNYIFAQRQKKKDQICISCFRKIRWKLIDYEHILEIRTKNFILGTDKYGTDGLMAPEILESARVGSAADIYSMGITFQEIIGNCKISHDPNPNINSIDTENIPTVDVNGASKNFYDYQLLCIERNPSLRPTILEILRCTWFDEYRTETINLNNEKDKSKVKPEDLKLYDENGSILIDYSNKLAGLAEIKSDAYLSMPKDALTNLFKTIKQFFIDICKAKRTENHLHAQIGETFMHEIFCELFTFAVRHNNMQAISIITGTSCLKPNFYSPTLSLIQKITTNCIEGDKRITDKDLYDTLTLLVQNMIDDYKNENDFFTGFRRIAMWYFINRVRYVVARHYFVGKNNSEQKIHSVSDLTIPNDALKDDTLALKNNFIINMFQKIRYDQLTDVEVKTLCDRFAANLAKNNQTDMDKEERALYMAFESLTNILEKKKDQESAKQNLIGPNYTSNSDCQKINRVQRTTKRQNSAKSAQSKETQTSNPDNNEIQNNKKPRLKHQ